MAKKGPPPSAEFIRPDAGFTAITPNRCVHQPSKIYLVKHIWKSTPGKVYLVPILGKIHLKLPGMGLLGLEV